LTVVQTLAIHIRAISMPARAGRRYHRKNKGRIMVRGVLSCWPCCWPPQRRPRPPRTAIVLPGDHLHPESVSILRDGTAYVGSMYGGVLKVSLKTGKARGLIAPGAYGSGALYGVLADPRHGLLWTCTNDFPGTGLAVPGADPGHWLKAFDLNSGKGKISLKLPGDKPVCNDMAVAPTARSTLPTPASRASCAGNRAIPLEVWLEDAQLGAGTTGGGLDGIALPATARSSSTMCVRARCSAWRAKPGDAGRRHKAGNLARSATPRRDAPDRRWRFPAGRGRGRVSRLAVQGDRVEVTTLAEGINQPTGVDVALGRGWYVQGQLAAIFRPATGPAQLPFRHPRFAEEVRLTMFPRKLFSRKLALLGAPLLLGVPAACGADAPQQGCAADMGRHHPAAGLLRHGFCRQSGSHPPHGGNGGRHALCQQLVGPLFPQRAARARRGFIIALKDRDGDGVADSVERFGGTLAKGSTAATGWRCGMARSMWKSMTRCSVTRWRRGRCGPPARRSRSFRVPETGDHPMHPFAIDAKGLLLINSGSATNTCESPNRQPGAKGQDPCEEAKTRGGIWAYSAGKEGQVFSPAERWAAGIRNTGGITFDTAGRVFATQHGRDQLSQNWSALYSTQQGEELPSEILFSPFKGADFGWPTCYFDGKRHVLAPEYGGDGGKVQGRCAGKTMPVAAFPAHWAPNDVAIYTGKSFPSPIAKVPSSPSTDRGTARPARRMAISWRSSR
jgi:hypothetical protein